MKVKPIFIVRVPESFDEETLKGLADSLVDRFKDYHILVIVTDVKDVQFEVFYEKDFNEVKYEELKEIVNNMVKK